MRPLHVLLLTILVIGLIGFTTKVLTDGGEAGGSSATTAVAAVTAAEAAAMATATRLPMRVRATLALRQV